MSPYLTVHERRQRAHGAVDRLQERLLAHDPHGVAELFALNAVIEFPFASPGWPAEITAIVSQTRYDTTDPDVLVVEWQADARHITVIGVGAGGIELFRDYTVAAGG
ncbi:hypothetical protein [Amycolatopsis sp. GM8]|uniref:hypothetical protein n=1 Tax=Amycolatopsis sp. GM8 TaxID=2896530 RepID=UPI001F1C916D|nr:hypothetical protein [Amycolatopsis sp. GM8]